ncbi:MAG: NADPH:quinone reductase [Chloroflexi bacterium RBG_16_54_11]|nr:MAG: NADPH:quinone reductase [Chloroflexi bacterium RBG_16_54_11]
MQAIRVHEYGGPEKLVYEIVPLPEPKAGEVRVKVMAAGVNFVETYQRRGWYAVTLPLIPGGEFAGVVDALGEDADDFHIGDRVATAAGSGAYAHYAIAQAGKLVHLPEGITLEQGAALLVQGMTAHYLALTTFPLKEGDTALVHAGAGGVGQLLLQIAKMRGARVIATVSTEEKAVLAHSAGADEVVLYSQADFETETKHLTGGKGVDVVYDSVGKTTFMKGLSCLRPRGMMVLFGQSSGPVEPFDPQTLQYKGSLFVTRPTLGHYTLSRDELLWRSGDLFDWFLGGKFKLRIDRTFPLHEAAAAHQYLEAGSTKGKVLLIP